MNETTKEEKVFQLCKELEETKKRKKDVVKGWNNEIKRLQDEIKDLVHPEKPEEELP